MGIFANILRRKAQTTEERKEDGAQVKETLDIKNQEEYKAEQARKKDHQTMKECIWDYFEEPEGSKTGQRIAWVMMLTITYSSIILAIETMPTLDYVDYRFWVVSEVTVTAIFTGEYVARIVTSPSKKFLKYDFIKDTMNVIDIVAIIPFYIALVENSGLPASQEEYVLDKEGDQGFLRVLRIIRLTRIFRLLKFGRYSGSLNVFFKTMQNSAGAIGMLMFLLFLNVVFFGALLYEVEKEEQQLGGDIFSIPQAMWCTIITMSTVGYGDFFPVTTFGKLIMCAAMLAGLLSVVLPVTIVGSESVKEYDNMIKKKQERLLQQGLVDTYLISTDMADAAQLNEDLGLNYSLEEEYEDPFGRELVDYDLKWGGQGRIALWEFFEKGETLPSKIWAIGTALVILLSCCVIVLSSIPALDSTPLSTWFWIETFCIAVFSIEYVSRWVINPELVTDSDTQTGVSKYMQKISSSNASVIVSSQLRFMLETFNLIDLLSIIPYYLTMSGHGWDFDKASTSDDGGPYAALRVMRLVRLVRVFKLGKHSEAVDTFTEAMKHGFPAMVMLFLFTFCYLLFFGALIYEVERNEEGTLFVSIPEAMWWGICTATTVGYGDIYPTTVGGKLIGAVAALVGVIGITLPLSIIGVFFAQISESRHKAKVAKNKKASLANDVAEPVGPFESIVVEAAADEKLGMKLTNASKMPPTRVGSLSATSPFADKVSPGDCVASINGDNVLLWTTSMIHDKLVELKAAAEGPIVVQFRRYESLAETPGGNVPRENSARTAAEIEMKEFHSKIIAEAEAKVAAAIEAVASEYPDLKIDARGVKVTPGPGGSGRPATQPSK